MEILTEKDPNLDTIMVIYENKINHNFKVGDVAYFLDGRCKECVITEANHPIYKFVYDNITFVANCKDLFHSKDDVIDYLLKNQP